MTVLTPDVGEAHAFLDRIYPDRFRVLVAINPLAPKGKEEIAGRTFEPGDQAGVERFIHTAYKKGWNVYYTVNPTLRPMEKKPKRIDVAEIRFLHVDVDPRKPEPDEREDMAAFLAREHERIGNLFGDKLPEGIPMPTVLVHSGGGFNALWLLASPLPIPDGTDEERLKIADGHKHYNRELERKFKADNCHNIDRVLRLPGTVNFPNHVKIAAGRTEPTLARLIFWEADRVYPITMFKQAPVTREQTSGPPPRLKLPSGPLPRIKDLEIDLDLSKIPKTADLVRRVIVDGRDVQNPERFCHEGKFDRSRAVYFVSKQLAAAGLAAEQIYAILSDPKFGISESLIEKGSSMERHVLRSVERGMDGAECDELAELNEQHAVIGSLGGACVIIQEEKDPSGRVARSRLTVSSFADIIKRYSHRKIQIGTKIKRGGVEEPVFQSLGQYWIDHPRRRQFDGLTFAPGKETPGYYNMWQGFAVEPVEGDCSLYLSHLHDVVCNGNDEHFAYLINWMAYAVQFPAEQAEVCVVLRGEQGTGKGFAIREFGKLFGRHYLQIFSSKHLVGQFNDHLRDCVILFLDEAFFAGDVAHKSVLKGLITESDMMVEKKGVDATFAGNFLHIMMASNEGWVVPADAKERRYFVLDVPSSKRGLHADYWNPLYKQMEQGGREALLFYLKNRDVTGFKPRVFPETAALHEQKLLSLTPLQEWWYQKLLAGQHNAHHARWEAPVICEKLQNDYLLYTTKMRSRSAAATEIGRFFTKVCPGVDKVRVIIEEKLESGALVKNRHWVYRFPPLAVCRTTWDREFGFITNWPDEEPDEEPLPQGGF